MKIGDYVTPNDMFCMFWICEPPFSVKVIDIQKNGAVHFEKNVKVYSIDQQEITYTQVFNICYLKVDIKKERKEKLKKLNSYENIR